MLKIGLGGNVKLLLILLLRICFRARLLEIVWHLRVGVVLGFCSML